MSPERPGHEVDGYRDLVEVGRGGFAIVYRAHQERFNRVVALKVLTSPDLDQRAVDRFEREVRAMGELSWHPHVVAVYDSGTTSLGLPYLAMEYLEAGSLGDRLVAEGPRPWEEVASSGIDVAGALGAAHAAGTLHRDVKPENLLVGPFGEIKLADFGIAAVEGTKRTTTGRASFTLGYVAPEILKGARPDERTDVYGVGATLHALLTGRPPFGGGDSADALGTLVVEIMEGPAPQHGDATPADLAAVLDRCLAKDPDDRPQGAAALGEALQAVQQAHGLTPTPLRLRPTSAAGPASTIGGEETSEAETPVEDRPEGEAAAGPDRSTGDPAETIQVAPRPAPGDPRPTLVHEDLPAPEPIEPTDGPESARRGGEGGAGDGDGEPAAQPRRRWWRRPAVLVGAVVVVVLVAAGLVALLSGDDSGPHGGEEEAGSTGVTGLPPDAPTSITVGTDPFGVVEAEGSVWASSSADDEVTRVDPATGDVLATIDVTRPGALVASPGTAGRSAGEAESGPAIWVTSESGVTQIDPADDSVVTEVDLGAHGDRLAFGDGATWASTIEGDGLVHQVDPRLQSAPFGDTLASALAVGHGAVFVATAESEIVRIDPGSGEVTETASVEGVVDLAIGDIGADEAVVWVLQQDRGASGATVLALDPETLDRKDVAYELSQTPLEIVEFADSLWIALVEEPVVLEQDTFVDETLTQEHPAGDAPITSMAAGTDAIWVTNLGDPGSVTRIDRP